MNEGDVQICEEIAPYGKILFKEECYQIQGAIFEVYREMGCGFLEPVYQECLARVFLRQKIPFTSQPSIKLMYKGEVLEQRYIPDFICYDVIVVELKAVKDISVDHKAQLINYLKSSQAKVGLLVNFGHYPRATIDRMVL